MMNQGAQANRAARIALSTALAPVVGVLAALLSTVAASDALFFKERVINRAEPKNPPATRPSFPLTRIDPYLRGYGGLPFNCEVALRYPAAFPNIATACSDPQNPVDAPLMQRAFYPIGAITGALFTNADGCLKANGSRLHYDLVFTQGQPGWIYRDPATNRFVQFASLTKHFLDDPSVGSYVFEDTKLYFRLSTDGGLTFSVPPEQQDPNGCYLRGPFRPAVKAGAQYSALHPFDDVDVKSNGVNLPGVAHIQNGFNGDVLVPVAVTPRDKTGIDLSEVTSYTDSYVLRGAFSADPTALSWSQSQRARVPQTLSMRGADEPAVLEIDSTGRCLIVARGSNQANTNIAGHYWLFQSADGCRTWNSGPTRWGYSDGTTFFAPAANSILFRSPRNNRIYWIGQMSASNSDGNWPRTTLVAAEVDPQNLGVIRDSVTIVDRMDAPRGDTGGLELNNAQIAIQPDGSAFFDYPRPDALKCLPQQCDSPDTWHRIDVSTSSGVQLSVSPTPDYMQGLAWTTALPDVVKWHLRRRYSSGPPMTTFWDEVGGPLSASARTTTIAGYEPWAEAEYEIVAERSDGSAVVSNRVVARFSQWLGPRLSFGFPTEDTAGATVPKGWLHLSWS